MFFQILCVVFLVIIILESTHIIKESLYRESSTTDYNTRIMYHLMVNRKSPSVYMPENGLYICKFEKNILVLMEFIIDKNRRTVQKYLITPFVRSKKLLSFISCGNKYIIDADGLWLDTGYKRVMNGEVLSCIEWIDGAIIDNTGVKLEATCYCGITDNIFIFGIHDSTNNQYATYDTNSETITITKEPPMKNLIPYPCA